MSLMTATNRACWNARTSPRSNHARPCWRPTGRVRPRETRSVPAPSRSECNRPRGRRRGGSRGEANVPAIGTRSPRRLSRCCGGRPRVSSRRCSPGATPLVLGVQAAGWGRWRATALRTLGEVSHLEADVERNAVSVDLQADPLHAVLLELARLQPADDRHPVALGDAVGEVLSGVTPYCDPVERGSAVDPGVTLLLAARHSYGHVRHSQSGWRVLQVHVSGCVTGERNLSFSSHDYFSPAALDSIAGRMDLAHPSARSCTTRRAVAFASLCLALDGQDT